MQDLIILDKNKVIIQSNNKNYSDTYENFIKDYGELPKVDVTRPLTLEELMEKYRFSHKVKQDTDTTTENTDIISIDYNRDVKSCWLNGYAFQEYPNQVCEDILNSIDTLLAKKAEREYVEPTPPTKEEIQKLLTDGVQNWMDSKVQKRNYDNVHTCVGTYLYSPIEKFRLEAEAVRDWVSYVWAKCYELLAQVEAGEREIPTLEEVINELPKLVW